MSPTVTPSIPHRQTPPSSVAPLPVTSTPSQNRSRPPSSVALQPSPQQSSALSFDSRIISDFPEMFAEFRVKRVSLLWRGSRDGFKAQEFHGRCDGHANTLTVILDTKGNIFGGFTPLEWESRTMHHWKADDSLKSFLFTLKNPHNMPARRFALKAEEKHEAIWCDSNWGPWFYALGVYDNCNSNSHNRADDWENAYTNDTGLNGKTFLTGSGNFQVQEIEVFEITD
jgi:hypothetical protein